MAGFIHIPKTASNPADLSAPSFLTTLAAEMRNAVYGILFKRDEPVLLHNVEAYHAKRPLNYLMTAQEIENFHQFFESEIGRDDEFRHNLQEGLSLLRSCRQVYHEAAGILYGQNAFIISRTLNRHDEHDYGMHDSFDYHQFVYAPRWLSGLGSQISLLKNVVIDMDGSCPSSCGLQLDSFDILPLLRLLWKYPKYAQAIRFAHTGRKVLRHTNETGLEMRNGDLPNGDLSQLFTRILHALFTKDTLDLRQYARHDCLLNSIEIYPLDLIGCISYNNSSCKEVAISTFAICQGDDTLQLVKKWPSPSLLGLSAQLRRRIFDFVVMPAEGVVFDLNRRTVHGLDLNILHLNRSTRRRSTYVLSVRRVNTVSLKLETKNKLILSYEFDALEEILPPVSENCFSKVILHDGSESRQIKISLEVNIATSTTLGEIRIDLRGLICLLRHPHLPEGTAVHVALSCPSGKKTYTEETRIPASRLQQELFLLLSDVIDEISYADLQGRLWKHDIIPKIWMDGRGVILEATYPATATTAAIHILNRHTNLRKHELRQRGYWMATTFELHEQKYFRESVPNSELEEDHELFDLWRDLRTTHWEDWRRLEVPGVCW